MAKGGVWLNESLAASRRSREKPYPIVACIACETAA